MQLPTYLTSPIFGTAKRQSKRLLTNRFRLVALLGEAVKKLNKIQNKGKLIEELKEKMFLFGRLLKAYASGQYRALSWKSVLNIVAAVIYFVNPADIIPDIIPFSGLIDDFTILVWTCNSLQSELDNFIQWEKSDLNQE